MTKVIKNGTIVTADRTWQADILIDGEKIAAIGPNLKGDENIDATDAYVIPGGLDPPHQREMPFLGTTPAGTFESGTLRAASGGAWAPFSTTPFWWRRSGSPSPCCTWRSCATCWAWARRMSGQGSPSA